MKPREQPGSCPRGLSWSCSLKEKGMGGGVRELGFPRDAPGPLPGIPAPFSHSRVPAEGIPRELHRE